MQKKEYIKIYIINKQQILLKEENKEYVLPYVTDFKENSYVCLQYLNDNKDFMIAKLKADTVLPEGYKWYHIKKVGRNSSSLELANAGLAALLLNWDLQTAYCGYCGCKTEYKNNERAKICPNCGLINYPRISPAMIVAIVKDGKLLLAHNRNFPEGLYSVLAGFMNPGETFEECVEREVSEEVGIKIRNVRYFGNQSWPYPDSHMVAFTADYESGEISEDNEEIVHAAWYKPEELPVVPDNGSISRSLIDWFVKNYG